MKLEEFSNSNSSSINPIPFITSQENHFNDTIEYVEDDLPLFIAYDENGLFYFPKIKYKEKRKIKTEKFDLVNPMNLEDEIQIKKFQKKQQKNLRTLSKKVFCKYTFSRKLQIINEYSKN